MYKNILVPVSFDSNRDTGHAIEVARRLGGDDATYTVLHAIEPLPGYYSAYLPQDALTINRTKVKEDLEAVAKTCDGAKTEVVDGRSGHEIVRWAHDNKVDCIVIASHEPTLSDFVLGSTAQYVVRHAKCAVHVIH